MMDNSYEEKIIIDRVNDYFNNLNMNDRLNYFKNMERITFKKCNNGFYLFPSKVYYNNLWILVHELFHISSYDRDMQVDGFCDTNGNGIALSEGMTEYLTMKFFDENRPTISFLETFSIEMLLNIRDFKSFYFRASREDFINTFVNKDNIIELSNLLDTYYRISHSKFNVRYEEIESLSNDILKLLLDILFENIQDMDSLRNTERQFICLLERYRGNYTLFNDGVVNKYRRVLGRF